MPPSYIYFLGDHKCIIFNQANATAASIIRQYTLKQIKKKKTKQKRRKKKRSIKQYWLCYENRKELKKENSQSRHVIIYGGALVVNYNRLHKRHKQKQKKGKGRRKTLK